ncbi:MAG: protein usg [Caulobacteraceae bacterium]
MGETGLERQLRGARLTTAAILYYMPDHPTLLQRFLWQALDEAPAYPRVHRFLDFWRREIDAVIHSVTLSSAGLVTPTRIGFVRDAGTLH